MGMYDTLNGEQVKCFPLVFLYHDNPVYSMGHLRSYKNGDMVPYKRYHYNYGKDFTIVETVRGELQKWSGYQFIVHVIRDGKLVKTTENSASEEDFQCPLVLDYFGEPFNVRSLKDIYDYLKEEEILNNKIDVLQEDWHALFREMQSLGQLYRKTEDKLSKEAQILNQKIEEISMKLNETEKNEAEKIKEISAPFHKKWKPEKKDEDCIYFGEWLSVLDNATEKAENRENKEHFLHEIKIASKAILKILEEDTTLLSRYLKWYDASHAEEDQISALLERACQSAKETEEE